MKRFMLPLLCVFLLCTSGCDKISSEAKVLIETASLASKERATSFLLIKDKLKATVDKDAAAFTAYCVSHQTALEAISKGLFDITKSLEKSSTLEQRTIDQLKELGKTVKASAENFKALDSKFVAKNAEDAPVVKEWAEAHRAGLFKMVELLDKLKDALEKDKKAKEQTRLSPDRREQFRQQLGVM